MSQAFIALRKTVGNIVGSIEGYPAATVAGNYSVGTLLATLRHLKTVCQRPASGRLAFIFPKGKKGVNAVNNPVGAIGAGVKNLRVAINPDHSAATLSDFARNTEGNIVRKIQCRLQAAD